MSGANNKISVLATDYFGEILERRVKILDQNNNLIAEFQTPGNFDFKPEQGKEYKAIIEKNEGNQLVFRLPGASNFGINSSVNQSIERNYKN